MPAGDYYYQIDGDIDDESDSNMIINWRSADLSKFSTACLNLNQVPEGYHEVRPGSGQASMKLAKDDNEAMFVPKGYAIMGFDADNCKETGNGVQFYHGYHGNTTASNREGLSDNLHKSRATVDPIRRLKRISGNKPGGYYNFKGSDGGAYEDQPRNIAKQMSSWNVYNLNDGLYTVLQAVDNISPSTGGTVAGEKRAIKRLLCMNVDYETFKQRLNANDSWADRKADFRSECENILSQADIDLVWPTVDPVAPVTGDKGNPCVTTTGCTHPLVCSNLTCTDPVVTPIFGGGADAGAGATGDEGDFCESDEDCTSPFVCSDNVCASDSDSDSDNNVLLYSGLATGVCSILLLLVIGLLLITTKKKK